LNPLEVARSLQRRYILRAAPRLGLVAYPPFREYETQLAELTTYIEDARPVRDKRPSTILDSGLDLTLEPDALGDVLDVEEQTGLRILEVGPKYGMHSCWIDEHLAPSEIVFCDFASDRHLHAAWEPELRTEHRFVYGDLRSADELLDLEPFDLVFFLGVLYHSTYHVQLLSMLNRVTRLGGSMVLQSTVDRRPDASVRLRWQSGTGKAKAAPSVTALRLMLAWTGWRSVTRFTDYRPGSHEALLVCRKTDELVAGSDFCSVVRPQRALERLPVTDAVVSARAEARNDA
jgi:SAM-dependent methyltransferase